MPKKASAPETTPQAASELVRRAPAQPEKADETAKPKKPRQPRNRFGAFRQLPSKRWQASYLIGTKRFVAPTTFRTKTEAREFLATIEAERLAGRLEAATPKSAADITVAQLVEEWLASDEDKRSSSRKRDASIMRLLDTQLAATSLVEVRRKDIQRQIDRWHKPPNKPQRAPATVARMYSALRAAFSYAVGRGYISDNPTVRPPGQRGKKGGKAEPRLPTARARSNARTRRSFDMADALKLAETMLEIGHEGKTQPEVSPSARQNRLIVLIGLQCGLRWGEVAGLTVGSVDLDKKRLMVREQLDRDGNLAPLKTDDAYEGRDIDIDDELADDLAAHIEERGIADQPEALLFLTPITNGKRGGTPLSYTNWRRRAWLKACERADLVGFQFHDLRRINATNLVALGIDIKTAQERLGHASPLTTLKIYAQATEEAKREAARKLGQAMRQGRQEP